VSQPWHSGITVDFLICAAAHRRDWTILTTDRDFQNYAKVLPLRLHAALARD
jgi:predicted nucleic acid-binding protein